ncbi:MAG: hypothetical protein NT016_01820 [Candidatus Aenigmarchaeota archaeon]|nr:hypothetical protein [Candidatus Aenigmarchaeota archaeon]
MSGKGIDSMIATVLLIAFTVAVGGILSVWLTSMASTQTETTGSAANAQTLCARSVLVIKEVDYSTTANANVTVGYNYGTENLTAINIYFVDSKRASANKTWGSGAYYSVLPGDLKTFPATSTGLTGDSFQTVRVVAMCQGSYPISTECKTGQSCMVKRAQ